ncbi:Shikimate kinase 1- chloroplastic [Striga hermonthica]|uniref:shikimate kinase n=1 Tax=Striga hermonthica TaxID=68872 RepID=A0A9N7NYZ7_STRHE|nr:Shikimate kinase 1- chloroplastic [Striga hermonthica]
MEAGVSSMGLQLGTWMNPENIARKPNNSLHFFQKYGERSVYQVPASCRLLATSLRFRGPKVLRVSCSDSSSASLLEAGRFPAFFDDSKIIKNKSEEVEPYLHGRCIYLVGMMGSGKTTIGKVLAEALGYSFYDCDKMIEEAVGGRTVAEIFKSYGEKFFRDNETEVLHELSSMRRLVVSTGGGAVIRPVNWRHMRKGVTVWLDVPLEALAQRITTVGTHSRPLLHHESGDPYSKTMKRLSALFEERGEAYANADVRVSLQNIAAKLGYEDVCNITPTAIALEVLVQLENFLKN